MDLIVVDTETSDLNPNTGATILEIAWVIVSDIHGIWTPVEWYETYIQYSGLISIDALAVHHISGDKLTAECGAIPRSEVIAKLKSIIKSDTIMVAHYAEFDSKFLPEITNPWICTCRSARHVFPTAPGFSNQKLRYWLKLNVQSDKHPHQAGYDVATTTSLLLKLLQTKTPEELLKISNEPVLLHTIGFGKHKGQKFETIPTDYLQWLSDTDKWDRDIMYTVRAHLESRRVHG